MSGACSTMAVLIAIGATYAGVRIGLPAVKLHSRGDAVRRCSRRAMNIATHTEK